MRKNFFIFLFIFSVGYMFNDIIREYNIQPITNASADVAGMDQFDLRLDYDFKKAVAYIVERECRVNNRYIRC
jgi:hypothetical protein